MKKFMGEDASAQICYLAKPKNKNPKAKKREKPNTLESSKAIAEVVTRETPRPFAPIDDARKLDM